MAASKPAVLAALLNADTDEEREARWAAFLAEFTPVILRAARSLGGGSDAAMDRYEFVLDMLRQEDCRRLGGYSPTESASFEIWLMVVVRRLSLDHHRRKYGRPQGSGDGSAEQHRLRRRLVDLVSEDLALDLVPTGNEDDAELALERSEVSEALAAALAALAVEDRLILRMRFEDDASVPEIARLLGEPSPFRTYRRLDRILEGLRRRLQDGGHVPAPRGASARRKADQPDPL